jgi:hypothetical protein
MKNIIEVLLTKIGEGLKKENKDLDQKSGRTVKKTMTFKRTDIDLVRMMDILRKRMMKLMLRMVLAFGIGMTTLTQRTLVSLTSRSSISSKLK